MPNIKPISKLKNKSNESCENSKVTREPMFLTKNENEDMVAMSDGAYENQQAQLDLYAKLTKADDEIVNGDEGTEYISFAKKMRENIQGII